VLKSGSIRFLEHVRVLFCGSILKKFVIIKEWTKFGPQGEADQSMNKCIVKFSTEIKCRIENSTYAI
jgi:hypothetical protein